MLLELTSVIACLWLATRFRRWTGQGENENNAWERAKRSMRWGVLIVTLPMLCFFGIVRYLHGAGFPTPFMFLLCSGLSALIFTGTRMEFTGNILFDTFFMSVVFTFACFTVVNGLPAALNMASGKTLCLWFLACTGAAFIVRAVMWALEGE